MNTIAISLAINAALGVGWIARADRVGPEVWPRLGDLQSVALLFPHPIDSVTEMPAPWTPTKIAIRAEDGELNLEVYGSLDQPESWAPRQKPVVYVYPDPDIVVGDLVAALDMIEDRAPVGTIIVHVLH